MSVIMLPVTNIQRFSTQDGPGVRTTVFLKGCPLRCVWCHNPETWQVEPEMFYSQEDCIGCGKCADICPTGAKEPTSKLMSIHEIMAQIHKDAAFYGSTGGVTLSGGEPLMHMQGCIDILTQAKAAGYTTAIQTSGHFDPHRLDELLPLTDLFLWDYKLTDPNQHQQLTGVTNEKILQNLTYVDARGGKTILHCIMIKGVNMDTAHYTGIRETRRKLINCKGVELIPYHPGAGGKLKRLGREDNTQISWIPGEKDMAGARHFVFFNKT